MILRGYDTEMRFFPCLRRRPQGGPFTCLSGACALFRRAALLGKTGGGAGGDFAASLPGKTENCNRLKPLRASQVINPTTLQYYNRLISYFTYASS